jgi:hypothetical protein
VLAGSVPPFDYFEMRQTFDVVLRELGLQLPADPRSAVRLYASERIGAVLTGAALASELLAELHDYCIELGYPRDLYDFYLLHNAWTDLQTDRVQWYWPGADRENIGAVVEDYFRVWLESSPVDAYQRMDQPRAHAAKEAIALMPQPLMRVRSPRCALSKPGARWSWADRWAAQSVPP